MLGEVLLRGALSAFSTMLGSLGVFFTYLSFFQPGLGVQALLFFFAATAIVYATPQN
jgi:hypothetical protein